MPRPLTLIVTLLPSLAPAATVHFFTPAQTATPVPPPGVTSDTITSCGYQFTYTRDKLFTGGVGMHGRPVRIPWPDGLEAQAVTVPPPGVTDYSARVTLRRTDGEPFDLPAFSFKLLANTGGAGAHLEIIPLLPDGEDAFHDPVFFQATGYYGGSFSYDESTPAYLGNTTPLKGFDTYKLALYVDFALTALDLVGPPTPGDANDDGLVDPDDYALLDRGFAQSLTGWSNGDFNHDGAITSADYLLIDQAFALQSGFPSPTLLSTRHSQFGPPYVSQLLTSIPEPTPSLLLLTTGYWLLATLPPPRRRS